MTKNICSACLLDLGADDKQTVACDSCRSRTHIAERCSGLSTSESRAVVLQKRTLMHFCNDCRDAFKSVPIMVRKMVKMEEEIKSLQERVLSLERGKSPEGSVSAETMVFEVSQRVARAQNLMIYRVPESDSPSLDVRISHDKSIVAEVFTRLGLQQEVASIKKVVRVGKIKTNTKPRPVKVVCGSTDTVRLATKSANRLTGCNYGISSDQTPMQQEAYKKAKLLLDSRQQAGETNLGIKYRNGLPVVEVKQQKNTSAPH